jgi:hypothetical protein
MRDPARLDVAVRVIERFGDPDSFVSVHVSLVEHAALGRGSRQKGAGQDRGKHHDGKALTGPLALE